MVESPKIDSPSLIIILLGPPGSGKGTQSEKISKAFSLPHISTGDLLRVSIKEGDSIGKIAKASLDQGVLVADSLILDMLLSRVSKKDCEKGYILDGFPRTLSQARVHETHLPQKAKRVVFNLSLSHEMIIERLKERLTCQECNAPYHLIYSPPQKKGECDLCRGALIQRVDDQEDVIRKRLIVYEKQTAPLISYYAEKKVLKDIPSNRDADQIFNDILRHLLIDLERE